MIILREIIFKHDSIGPSRLFLPSLKPMHLAIPDSMDYPGSDNESTMLRYELIVDGRVLGFVDYYLFDAVILIMHTEVDPALEGKGYGSRVAAEAMEYARSQGKRVVPICGFMAHYLRKHPQHLDLVTPASRRVFNIGAVR